MKKKTLDGVAILIIISVLSLLVITIIANSEGIFRGFKIPTVYLSHGETDTCEGAIDADGREISCEEARKGGQYHIVWVAPKTLRGE